MKPNRCLYVKKRIRKYTLILIFHKRILDRTISYREGVSREG